MKIKRQLFKICNLILFLLLTVLSISIKASNDVVLESNKSNVLQNEEFEISVNSDSSFAACTIWIYFDGEKVECVSKDDNVNVSDNRVIFTWFSENGKNKSINELLGVEFKAKEDGIAAFSVIGEFYNENGEKIDTKYKGIDVKIGEESAEKNEANGKNDEETSVENNTSSNNTSKDNANLDIMRLGHEGINPDFNKNIEEYYLVVGENVNNIDVTAIPENREASVEITGNKNLVSGINKIEIIVTSQDKSKTKKYVINVTKTDNAESANSDLAILTVENYSLTPEFSSNVTNYSIEIPNNINEVNILAVPNNIDSSVKVVGNDNLKFGENNIEITVIAPNGITQKTYNLSVYKRNETEEEKYEEEQETKVEQDTAIVDKISSEEVVDEINEIEADNINNEEMKNDNTNKTENVVFMIIGTILVIVVIGVIIIRIKKRV